VLVIEKLMGLLVVGTSQLLLSCCIFQIDGFSNINALVD
jgi:hypothetical protein